VGWEPATRTFTRKATQEEVTVPNVGVLMNTPTLFVHLENYFEDNDTILDSVFAITRNGADQNTSYTVTPQKGEIAEITDEVASQIDLAEYLEGLADSEAIRELVESAPDGFEFNFSKRGKADDKPKSAKGKGKKVAAPVEDDDDDEWDEEDEEEDDAVAERKSRFDEMRAKMS
jgi:hypothetical protein